MKKRKFRSMQQNLHTVSRSINSQAAHIRNSLSEMEKMLDKIASNEDIKNKKENTEDKYYVSAVNEFKEWNIEVLESKPKGW